MRYLKIEYRNVVYYINTKFVEHTFKSPDMLQQRLLQNSDYAINKRTNEVIKCRQSLESVFDKILEV